jgi:hypothetical protein
MVLARSCGWRFRPLTAIEVTFVGVLNSLLLVRGEVWWLVSG